MRSREERMKFMGARPGIATWGRATEGHHAVLTASAIANNGMSRCLAMILHGRESPDRSRRSSEERRPSPRRLALFGVVLVRRYHYHLCECDDLVDDRLVSGTSMRTRHRSLAVIVCRSIADFGALMARVG
nr:hypothetical protein CFP56_09083 [Quercus suber]